MTSGIPRFFSSIRDARKVKSIYGSSPKQYLHFFLNSQRFTRGNNLYLGKVNRKLSFGETWPNVCQRDFLKL